MRKGKLKYDALAVIAGFANGFFGGGGGVVALIVLKGMPQVEAKNAHATSVAMMLPVSVLSTVIYLLKEALPPWDIVLITMAGTLAGGFVGARLLKKIRTIWLTRAFAVFVVFSSIRMIFF
ncbi:MAG: TSUP family transporter [Christensenellales bacterium]|jgi:uncharacterized membrane protein YfcA